MRSKLSFIIGVLAVLAMACGAYGATWTGDGDGTSWDDASNWDPAVVPGSSDPVDMNTPERGPIIDVDVECGVVHGPVWDTDTPMVVDIIEGNVRLNGTWRFAQGGTGLGTVNISGGDVSVGDTFRWGDSTGSYGIVNISGGTVTCPHILIGDDGGGELHISGSGVLMTTGDSEVARRAPTIITMDGGTFTTLGELSGGSLITFKIYAGTMECGSYQGGFSMDIEEGQFIVGGDETTALNAEVSAGRITAYGNESGTNDSEVNVDYDSELDKTIVTATMAYTWAHNPSPSTGAQNLCPDDVELSWTAGVDATHHDIYLGTDLTAVENATTSSDEFMLRQTETTYSPVGLAGGVTYYWRIDEFDGSSVVPGRRIWSFKTNDGTAYDPDPAHNATLVDIEADLSWTEGCGANSHNVYFGTDFNDVNDGINGTSKGNQAETTFEPGTLSFSTFYYWRIDEVGTSETLKGQMWKFRSRSAIVDPNMVVWYTFDEESGSTAADSSGYERHASAFGTPEAQWEPNEGRFGGAVRFDTDDLYVFVVPVDTLSTVTSAVSVSVWVNGEVGADDTVVVFDAGDNGLDGDNKLTGMVPNPGGAVSFRAGDDVNDVLVWSGIPISVLQGEWHHFAFVKNAVADSMSIYFDAQKVATKSGVSSTVSGLGNKAFHIGAHNASNDSEHESAFDDFRVFDKALTDSEIAGLFRGGDVDTAWAPSPYNGEPDVDRDSMLKWRPGDYVDLHDVYFGTSFDDVNDADTTSDVYVDRRGPNEYAPPTDLAMNTTYYWRIDEVNTTDPNLWKGAVWTFKVANFIVVDSFETYTCDNDMYVNWLDGWNNHTGSTLLLSVAGDPTHGADKSQLYSYNNMGSPYYSEAERVLGAGEQDFTEAGVEILTMYFYGKSTNTATTKEQLYAGLDDGGTYAEVRYGTQEGESITDIQIEDWTEWNVALSDFTDVTLSSVDSLFVGFGSRSASSAGGNGLVYFDDIRLYPSRCIPSKGLMEADLSGNCVIDIADVGIMGTQWLLTDINFPNLGITVTEPSTTNLVGFWKLEGNGDDSSGKGNNGTPEGTYSWVTGYDGVNQAIEFNGGKVLVPDDATLRPASVVSAACWVCYSGNPGGGARVVVKGPDNFEAYCIEMIGAYQFKFYVGDVNGTRYHAPSEEGDVRPSEWLHVGGTYDGTTVKSYVNGLVVGTEEANSISLSQDTNGLAIGNRSDANDHPYAGIVDEVRVYNVALSQAEMAWLATDGTGYVPLRSKANLYDEEWEANKSVNMRDYAELMLSWLDEKLWPRDY